MKKLIQHFNVTEFNEWGEKKCLLLNAQNAEKI